MFIYAIAPAPGSVLATQDFKKLPVEWIQVIYS